MSNLNPKKFHRKRLILGVVVSVFVVAITLFALKLNAPSKGTINTNPKPITKKQSQNSESAPQTQQNSYYTLQLPAGYTSLPASNPTAGILYSQSLTKQLAIGHLIVSIAIKPLPEGGLEGDSNYQLRLSQPNRYTIQTDQVDGETVRIANDQQSSAVVAFWPHQQYLATISLTLGFDGPPSDGNASEIAALNQILQGWDWQ